MEAYTHSQKIHGYMAGSSTSSTAAGQWHLLDGLNVRSVEGSVFSGRFKAGAPKVHEHGDAKGGKAHSAALVPKKGQPVPWSWAGTAATATRSRHKADSESSLPFKHLVSTVASWLGLRLLNVSLVCFVPRILSRVKFTPETCAHPQRNVRRIEPARLCSATTHKDPRPWLPRRASAHYSGHGTQNRAVSSLHCLWRC